MSLAPGTDELAKAENPKVGVPGKARQLVAKRFPLPRHKEHLRYLAGLVYDHRELEPDDAAELLWEKAKAFGQDIARRNLFR